MPVCTRVFDEALRIRRSSELNEWGLRNFAVADAGRTDANALARAFDHGVNRLQVQIPTTLCHIVGMTDAMPELWPATTDFTNFCHKNTLPLPYLVQG